MFTARYELNSYTTQIAFRLWLCPFLEIKMGQIIWAQLQFPQTEAILYISEIRSRAALQKKKCCILLIAAVYHFRAQKQLA